MSSGFSVTSSGGMGERFRTDSNFFSSLEVIIEKGDLSPSCSLNTLLMWHTINDVFCTVSELKLVPFGRILRINLWLFSTCGFCQDAWGSQKNTFVLGSPAGLNSRDCGSLNLTPFSIDYLFRKVYISDSEYIFIYVIVESSFADT